MRKSLADTYIIIIATDVDAPDIDYIHCLNEQIWFNLLQNDSTGSKFYRSDFKTKLDLCAVWTKALSSDVLSTTLFDFSNFASWWICFKRFPLPFFCFVIFFVMSKQTFKSIIFKEVTLLHQLYFNASTKKWIFQCSVKSVKWKILELFIYIWAYRLLRNTENKNQHCSE